MTRLNELIAGVLLTFCITGHLAGPLNRLISSKTNDRDKRQAAAVNWSYEQRFGYTTDMYFDTNVVRIATVRRNFHCFFVFDYDASADLKHNITIARQYADTLAAVASKYVAHANMVITNAGTEIWSTGDRISFALTHDFNITFSNMPDFATRFQDYLAQTQSANFGRKYSVGVLLSNKANLVGGGFTFGPPNTTSGVSLLKYREVPWVIASLLSHEMAHTLSVIHPWQLVDYCPTCHGLKFCSEQCSTGTFCGKLPDECTCVTSPEKCLMSNRYGASLDSAARYTRCDIEMMNYFATHEGC